MNLNTVPIVNIGLKKEALDFISQNVEMIPDIVCPDCGKVINEKPNVIDLKSSEELITLVTYKLKNGKTAETIKQAIDVIGDGAVVFLCLLVDGKTEFEWSNKEISSLIASRER